MEWNHLRRRRPACGGPIRHRWQRATLRAGVHQRQSRDLQDSVYDSVVELASKYLSRKPIGDPLKPNTMMGPVVSHGAADRIMSMIERAKTEGRLIIGGERLGGEFAHGYFIPPTVFADVDNNSYIAQNEVFGKV
jgi:aldehyde dehydrogenase (NAD+)